MQIVGKWWFFVCALVLTISSVSAQDLHLTEKKKIKTIPIRDGIFMLVGKGGNIGASIGSDGVFLIDDQFANMGPSIQSALAELTSYPTRFLINTHWHQDHTGGNEYFGNQGVVIVAHENVRKRLNSEQFVEFFGSFIAPSPHAALPVITFTDDLMFHLNRQDVKIKHFRHAHTDGDVVVFFEQANVIHMGDVYFEGMYPFIDHGTGGTLEGMIAAVRDVLVLIDDETKVIPGHGPLSNKLKLSHYRDMLVTVRHNINQLIEQGKSLKEIKDIKPTLEFDETWGKGFISPVRFTELIYKDLMLQKSATQEQAE